MLEEYYNLDHEDDVAGVKTRFRYRSVEPIHDGLEPAEILALPDKDLNAIVGLRKLAPYHVDTQRIRPNYKALAEAREQLKEQGLYVDKRAKARLRKSTRHQYDASHTANEAAPAEGPGKRKGGDGRAPGVDVSAAPTSKRKRPGPALRRALKAAAAAEASAPAPGQQESAPAPTQTASKTRSERKSEPLSAEEQKRRRLESYGKLTLPGATVPLHGVEDERKVKHRHMSQEVKTSKDGHVQHQQRSAAGEASAALPPAAKKNLKRALKRQAARQAAA